MTGWWCRLCGWHNSLRLDKCGRCHVLRWDDAASGREGSDAA